jgi:hypothetical protein
VRWLLLLLLLLFSLLALLLLLAPCCAVLGLLQLLRYWKVATTKCMAGGMHAVHSGVVKKSCRTLWNKLKRPNTQLAHKSTSWGSAAGAAAAAGAVLDCACRYLAVAVNISGSCCSSPDCCSCC